MDLVRAQIDAIGQVALAADKVTNAPSTDLRPFLLSLNEMSSSIAEVIAIHGSLQDVYYGSLIPRYNMALAGLSTW